MCVGDNPTLGDLDEILIGVWLGGSSRPCWSRPVQLLARFRVSRAELEEPGHRGIPIVGSEVEVQTVFQRLRFWDTSKQKSEQPSGAARISNSSGSS